MRILCALLAFSTVILNQIESSSQSERSPDRSHHSASSQQPAGTTARSRSRSPTLSQTFRGLLGFKFEDLAFIRLLPYSNPNRIFELRKYVFPPDKPIRLRRSNLGQSPMPTGEQIVLSTPDGDVCAILDKSKHKSTILRALCTLDRGRHNRAKINMYSEDVEGMTAEEISECPVSTRLPVTKMYGLFRVSPPASSHHPSSSSASSLMPIRRNPVRSSESPALSETFSSVLGYKFDDLESIRLSPYNHTNQIFKLRVYVFPPGKPIGLRTKNRVLNPVPTGDQIVLTTSNGDVCAILGKSSTKKDTVFRPILTSSLGVVERVKINISSGAFERITAEEIAQCPAVSGESVKQIYIVFRV